VRLRQRYGGGAYGAAEAHRGHARQAGRCLAQGHAGGAALLGNVRRFPTSTSARPLGLLLEPAIHSQSVSARSAARLPDRTRIAAGS
jgi:hypothetical protein